MQIVQAIILGIVQGVTEFLPVSSSGHLILVGRALNFHESTLAFDVALHIGTLVSLLAVFWRDFSRLAVSLFKRTHESKLAWVLVISTFPAVLAGLLLESKVATVFRSAQSVAINLIIVAIIMLVADRVGRRRVDLGHVTPEKGLGIGFAQALAVVPGVSRSGATISAGLLQGLDRVAATRFSFYLSAPIIAGAIVKELSKGENIHTMASEPLIYGAGIIAAAVSGHIAIKFMLNYLSRYGISAFAYYRIAIGLVILTLGIK